MRTADPVIGDQVAVAVRSFGGEGILSFGSYL